MKCFLPVLFLVLLGAVPRESVERIARPEGQWEKLEALQGSVSREAFEWAMDTVYAPKADWRKWMEVTDDGVRIAMGDEGEDAGEFFLAFADEGETARPDAWQGLAGLRVAIDPGHIGGEWGPIEERSFSVAGGPVFQEGDITLATAVRLERELVARGAEVLLLREGSEPVTSLRAEDFREEAERRLPGPSSDELRERRARLAERLFYRSAEIRARADRLEAWGEVDLAIALHINASADPEPGVHGLYEQNDAHLLINGCYLEGELAKASQRSELLYRLLKGYHLQELALGEEMAKAMREATALPAYVYEGDSAAKLGEDAYLWGRNLMAGRIYDCPVLYLEPWRANSPAVYAWAAAGDYEGLREFDGQLKPSLPAVYCEFIIQGLLQSLGR